MSNRIKDLAGERFGRWTVLSHVGPRSYWLCRCDCSTERIVFSQSLRSGGSKSCGCLSLELITARMTTHGKSSAKSRKLTPEYRTWASAKSRCQNSNSTGWKDYGGRGIKMCDEWTNSFSAFLSFIGTRPSAKHSLDRYPDNDGDYRPGNVRWATGKQQQSNRRPMPKRKNPWRPDPSKFSRITIERPKTPYRHGMSKRSEYKIWTQMKQRCFNVAYPQFEGHGGRGISVHEEWIFDFLKFFEYIGPRPSKRHSLDRYPDNDGNYEPDNVRWATPRQQAKNRRQYPKLKIA